MVGSFKKKKKNPLDLKKMETIYLILKCTSVSGVI